MFGRTGARYFGLRGSKLNVAIAMLAGLDFLLFGYDQGVMGGLLTLPSFTKIFPALDTTAAGIKGLTQAQATHKSTMQGVAIGSYTIGCFVGALACLKVGDWLGRRMTIFVGSSIMVIGAILQCTAFSLSQLIVGRVITGLGNGLNTSTVPTWQSECSKSHRRGQLVLIEGALVVGGVCISYWLDFGFSFCEPSSVSWRFPVAFQLVFSIIILAFILELPESPRWLVLKGNEDEARNVMCALNDIPPDDPFIINELHAIKSTVHERESSWRDMFTNGEQRRFHRLVLGSGTQLMQQIAGINLVTYYSAVIYQNEIGLSGFMARILAACSGTEYFLASWIGPFIIERTGRRKLLMISSVGLAISMAVMAGMTKIGGSGPGIVACIFLFVYNTAWALGWLAIPWLYPAEIVPLQIRAPANAVSTAVNWAFNFMVVMITPICFSSIGWRTYIIFAVFNVCNIPVVYFFYPETAYRSLEEMDIIFGKCKSIFTVVRIAKEEPRRYGKKGELLINYEEAEEHLRRENYLIGGEEKKNQISTETTNKGEGAAGDVLTSGNGTSTHHEQSV